MNGWCGVSLSRTYERQRLVLSDAVLIIGTQVGPGQDTTGETVKNRQKYCLTCCKIVTVVFCVFFCRKSVNDLMPILKSVSIIVLNDFCILIIFIQNILAWSFIFIFNETAYFKDNICFSQKFPQNKSHMVQRVWRNIQKNKTGIHIIDLSILMNVCQGQ